MDKLNLKLNGKVVEITQDDNGRYCLNDLFKASGGDDSKKPSKWLRYQKELGVVKVESGLKVLIPEDFDSYVVKTGKARATKTFGSRKTALKYAMFIDKNFYEAVVEAFDKLTTGDVQEAANIASEYTLTPEIISKCDKVTAHLKKIISERVQDKPHYYNNIFRVISKASTGYTPKELTGGFSSASEYIKGNNHLPAMNAYIACVEITTTLIVAGVTDYHVLAAAIGAETGKNKQILLDAMVG